MRKITKSMSDVQQRILNAAGEVFAEKGFRDATVREICKRAGVNVASINYHFRNKETLYIEVVKYWIDISFQKYPLDFAMDESNLLEDRLRAYIKCILLHIHHERQTPWFVTVVARESIESKRILDSLIQERIHPVIDLLSSIVRQLLGEKANEEKIALCCSSILGQCIFYNDSRHIMEKFFKLEKFSEEEIESIVEHITCFSLSAIKEYMINK